MYSEWSNKQNGEIISTFTIITTDANDLLAEIHNTKKRMPAILSRDEEKKWIDLSITTSEASGLLKPCPPDILKAHTIGPLVNNRYADRNTPEVIREYSQGRKDNLF